MSKIVKIEGYLDNTIFVTWDGVIKQFDVYKTVLVLSFEKDDKKLNVYCEHGPYNIEDGAWVIAPYPDEEYDFPLNWVDKFDQYDDLYEDSCSLVLVLVVPDDVKFSYKTKPQIISI